MAIYVIYCIDAPAFEKWSTYEIDYVRYRSSQISPTYGNGCETNSVAPTNEEASEERATELVIVSTIPNSAFKWRSSAYYYFR